MATRHRTVTPTPVRVAGNLCLLVAVAVAALAAAGCAGTVPTAATHGAPPVRTPAPTPSSTPAATPSARASATPAGTPRGTTTVAVAGRDTAAGFPGDARPYAEAVLAAWGQRQVARLGDLTTPAVRQQLLSLSPPDQRWTYQLCEGAAGSSYCSFVNADGDVITLRVINQWVGTAHATTEVRFDPTVYPAEAREYVKGFVEAWRNGNAVRMRALASQAEADFFAPADSAEHVQDLYLRVGLGLGGAGVRRVGCGLPHPGHQRWPRCGARHRRAHRSGPGAGPLLLTRPHGGIMEG